MNRLKKIIRRALNYLKFIGIHNSRFSKNVLLDAKKGLYIEAGENASLQLRSPCFTSRKNVSFYIQEDGVLSIGGTVFFNENCTIACRKKITIGDNCLFGPNVCIYDHDHMLSENHVIERNTYKTSPVIIGNNVWIGAGSIILKGSQIGNNVIIGAGSVISGIIPDNVICVQKRENTLKEWI